jgi:hypothetical protein
MPHLIDSNDMSGLGRYFRPFRDGLTARRKPLRVHAWQWFSAAGNRRAETGGARGVFGVSEWAFQRWRDGYHDEDEAGLLDRRLGRASGERVPSEEVEALYRERYQGVHRQAVPRPSGEGPWLRQGLPVDKAASPWKGLASAPLGAATAAGGDAALGRLAARLGRGRSSARSGRDPGRCEGGDLFGLSG